MYLNSCKLQRCCDRGRQKRTAWELQGATGVSAVPRPCLPIVCGALVFLVLLTFMSHLICAVSWSGCAVSWSCGFKVQALAWHNCRTRKARFWGAFRDFFSAGVTEPRALNRKLCQAGLFLLIVLLHTSLAVLNNIPKHAWAGLWGWAGTPELAVVLAWGGSETVVTGAKLAPPSCFSDTDAWAGKN